MVLHTRSVLSTTPVAMDCEEWQTSLGCHSTMHRASCSNGQCAACIGSSCYMHWTSCSNGNDAEVTTEPRCRPHRNSMCRTLASDQHRSTCGPSSATGRRQALWRTRGLPPNAFCVPHAAALPADGAGWCASGAKEPPAPKRLQAVPSWAAELADGKACEAKSASAGVLAVCAGGASAGAAGCCSCGVPPGEVGNSAASSSAKSH